ncbi:MAG: DUF2848 domain-containing protein [Ottowia sp.]|uniref:DUF2848 domain-containing protein n=1 Tax=Ottowia sp. TaxID=1898956 RepID=UPI0039E69991
MQLNFKVFAKDGPPRDIAIDIEELVVAGWAGRDRDAIEHHIEELAALGVPRPSKVPLYYRVAANQLVQSERVQVIGKDSSGEAEVLVFTHAGELMVSLASDHTDRRLEAHSVAFSKQLCVKPVARTAWRFVDVAEHWDQLVLRSDIVEGDAAVAYQDGPLAMLRRPLDLIAGYTGGQTLLPAGCAMTCGTVAAIGGIRPSASFAMELADPVLQRSLRHTYAVDMLAEVA